MIARIPVALLACLLWAATALAAPPPSPYDLERLTYKAPLRVQLDEASPPSLVVGVRTPVKLVIRNITGPGSNQPPVAIVLRGLAWTGDPVDRRTWLRSVMGDVREQTDGTLVFDGTVRRIGDVRIESALLFPGQQVTIDMPFTPQKPGKQSVDITYGIVGGIDTWASNIWLVREGEGRYVFWPRATHADIAAAGLVGGSAVVRQSMRPSTTPLVLSHETWSVDLPVRADEKGTATGGVSLAQALRAVGWSKGGHARPKHGVWAYWRPALHAWIFVAEDGTAVALRIELGRSQPEPMPRMAVGVPEAFGSAAQESTEMILRPDVFSDMVNVQRAVQGEWYDPGLTRVPIDQLWSVLRRAAARGVELRMVTYDANGLGNEQALSAGVRLDQGGRWLPLESLPR